MSEAKFAPEGIYGAMVSRHENITAIKESSGDIKLLLKLATLIRKEHIDIKVMLGREGSIFYRPCSCPRRQRG